jgi:hypothetical protein
MAYIFRPLMSNFQALKEYRSNYHGYLNALWDPNAYKIIIVTTWNRV